MDSTSNNAPKNRGIFRRPGRFSAPRVRETLAPRTARKRFAGATEEQKAAREAVARRQQQLAAAFPKMPQRPHPDTPRQMARRLIADAIRAEFAREAASHIDLPDGWGRTELQEASYQSAPWFLSFSQTTLDALEIAPATIPISDVPELLASPATSDGYGLGLEAAADLASVLLTQAWHLEYEMAIARGDGGPSRTLDDQVAGEAEALRGEASRILVRIVTVPLDLKAVLVRARRAEATEDRVTGHTAPAEDPLGLGGDHGDHGDTGRDHDTEEQQEPAASAAGGGHFFRPGGAGQSSGGASAGPDVLGKIRSLQEFAQSPEGQQMMALMGVGAREAWRMYQQRNGGTGKTASGTTTSGKNTTSGTGRSRR